MTDRLKTDLIHISAIGRPSGQRIGSFHNLDSNEGITRPEGSPANKILRAYTLERMRAAGLTVRVDRVGNIFGRTAGTRDHLKTVMIGSHLDSVVNGGNLDGALGVFCGIEAVRRLQDERFKNLRPIEVVAFTGEEGSAFITGSMLGSAVLVGNMSAEEALCIQNVQGESLGDVLGDIGYQGDFTYPAEDIGDFVELHIEQGPILDAENISVGIVETINGLAWLKTIIKGSENHAGTTPMHARRDALVAAADAVGFLNRRARKLAQDTGAEIVGTTGRLTVQPNNTNIIPGAVELGQDIRAARPENMNALINETAAYLKGLANTYAVEVQVFEPDIQQPLQLSQSMADTIEAAAVQADVSFKRMHSGAVHDAQNMAAVARAGMIFVPSVNGISHSPLEWTDWEDIEKGVTVLTGVVKNLAQQE